mgnify:CR=1 FL=1
MEVTYVINDNFDYCSLDYNDISYKYYDLLELLKKKRLSYINTNKINRLSDLVQLEDELNNFEKTNLNKEEVKDFEYWKKQSKAKSWFSSQRIKRRKGKLKHYQIEMLNKIGMVWNPKEDDWEKNFLEYRKNRVSDILNNIQNREYGASSNEVLNLKSQELWIKEQRNSFKTNRIKKENLTRLNAINFPFTPSADELSGPTIYSLINFVFTIRTLNEELKRSRKTFVNFYELPKEKKTSGAKIRITESTVRKTREDRKKLELQWDKKRNEKWDKENEFSEKTAKVNVIEFLNSKSTEYFIEQIDRYGKQKPLTWNEKQTFKDAENDYESDIPYHSNLYYNAYNRLSSFLSNNYYYQGKIKGKTYSTSIKYQFNDEVKRYTSEKMLNILDEKLIVTGRFNKTKSFIPISFLLKYYKSKNLVTDLVRLYKIIQRHQILSLIYAERIEKIFKKLN